MSEWGGFARRHKIALIGDSTVGKTSLLKIITNSDDLSLDSTVGGQSFPMTLTGSQGPVLVILWDTAGSERYRALMPIYLRDCAVVGLCFALDNPESFEAILKTWLGYVENAALLNTKKILVGCKADLPDRQILQVDAEKCREEIKARCYVETSSVTPLGIDALVWTMADLVAEFATEVLEQTQPARPVDNDKSQKTSCC
jgi:small GTP-binding protein